MVTHFSSRFFLLYNLRDIFVCHDCLFNIKYLRPRRETFVLYKNFIFCKDYIITSALQSRNNLNLELFYRDLREENAHYKVLFPLFPLILQTLLHMDDVKLKFCCTVERYVGRWRRLSRVNLRTPCIFSQEITLPQSAPLPAGSLQIMYCTSRISQCQPYSSKSCDTGGVREAALQTYLSPRDCYSIPDVCVCRSLSTLSDCTGWCVLRYGV